MVPLRVGHRGHSVRAQFAGSIRDIYTRVIALTQTTSTPLHGINSTHTSQCQIPHPPLFPSGEMTGKRGVRSYPMDLNGTAKENTEATGSFMHRRNFGGIGGCRGGGVGECVVLGSR